MSKSISKNTRKNNSPQQSIKKGQFSEPDYSRPNDFINGVTITAVMLIVIMGVLYGLYWMP
jgi:hypothetical protein